MVGIHWILLVLGAGVATSIQVLGQTTDITIDPLTGQKTQTYLFFLRATQADNAATFLAYNITWLNSTATGWIG
jgi:hypothetical protein